MARRKVGYEYNPKDVEELNDFICPISKKIMRHPDILPCGHDCGHDDLNTWAKVNPSCPVCRTAFKPHEVKSNEELKRQINEYMQAKHAENAVITAELMEGFFSKEEEKVDKAQLERAAEAYKEAAGVNQEERDRALAEELMAADNGGAAYGRVGAVLHDEWPGLAGAGLHDGNQNEQEDFLQAIIETEAKAKAEAEAEAEAEENFLQALRETAETAKKEEEHLLQFALRATAEAVEEEKERNQYQGFTIEDLRALQTVANSEGDDESFHSITAEIYRRRKEAEQMPRAKVAPMAKAITPARDMATAAAAAPRKMPKLLTEEEVDNKFANDTDEVLGEKLEYWMAQGDDDYVALILQEIEERANTVKPRYEM